jgi:hypothetical protein
MRGGNSYDGGSARHETLTRPPRGSGLAMQAKCDECQAETAMPRRRAKVLSGPLRGLAGMVCRTCIQKRGAA